MSPSKERQTPTHTATSPEHDQLRTQLLGLHHEHPRPDSLRSRRVVARRHLAAAGPFRVARCRVSHQHHATQPNGSNPAGAVLQGYHTASHKTSVFHPSGPAQEQLECPPPKPRPALTSYVLGRDARGDPVAAVTRGIIPLNRSSTQALAITKVDLRDGTRCSCSAFMIEHASSVGARDRLLLAPALSERKRFPCRAVPSRCREIMDNPPPCWGLVCVEKSREDGMPAGDPPEVPPMVSTR